MIPLAYYEIYGDMTLLKQGYPAMVRWLSYMENHSEKGLIVREEEGGWCLGEWCTPPGFEPPELSPEFVNTYYYIKGLLAAQRAGRLLGKPDDKECKRRLREAKKAMCERFYDSKTESFCKGVNGADAFALDIGLGTAKTLANLIKKYEETKCLDTGIFGTPVLIEVLMKNGAENLAYELLVGNKEYSFTRMMEAGATTLWETWDGKASHNHPMFGGVVSLLFTEILGICQSEDSAGFKRYEIKPKDIKGLSWAEGRITTTAGPIRVRWERNSEGSLCIVRGGFHKK